MKLLLLLFFSANLFASPISKDLTNTSKQEIIKITTESQSSGIWHDLITPDLEASKAFYGNLLGWTFTDTNFKGLRYTIIYNDGKVIGGMIEIKSAKNATWISALPLDNATLSTRIKAVIASGAKAVLPPIKLPGRGKQVVFEGPSGEEFSLISENEYTAQLDESSKNGNWIGMELWADNPAQASAFYDKAFAVSTTKSTYDNKPYWTFKADDKIVAGMLQNPVTNQGSQWVPYIQQNDIGAMLPALKKSGANILMNPNNNIRDGKIGIFQDPQGAIFAVQTL